MELYSRCKKLLYCLCQKVEQGDFASEQNTFWILWNRGTALEMQTLLINPAAKTIILFTNTIKQAFSNIKKYKLWPLKIQLKM